MCRVDQTSRKLEQFRTENLLQQQFLVHSRKGREIETQTLCASAVRRKMMAQRKFMRLRLRKEIGEKIPTFLFRRSIKNLNLSDFTTPSKSMGRPGSERERDKISMFRELELRNRPFQENPARDCQEIEELRSICCEEANRARQARRDELSMQQERNPTTVSQMMARIRELQNNVNSLSDARESYDPESGSSSGATHVPDQTSTKMSSGTLPRCDSGLPRKIQTCTGIMGNVFERPPCSRRTVLYNLQQFMEFYIFLSGIET